MRHDRAKIGLTGQHDWPPFKNYFEAWGIGTFEAIDNKGNSFETIKANETLTHQPTVWHVHIHITWAVAAMGSCFWLIRPHQYGIATGQKKG